MLLLTVTWLLAHCPPGSPEGVPVKTTHPAGSELPLKFVTPTNRYPAMLFFLGGATPEGCAESGTPTENRDIDGCNPSGAADVG